MNCGAIQIDRLLGRLSQYWLEFNSVVLDFGSCLFLSAEGAAILAAFTLRRNADERKTLVDWATVQPKLLKQLRRWQFADLFGHEPFPWTGRAIPICHQSTLDSDQLVAYICTYVHQCRNMPQMTDKLAKKVRESICEVFTNVFHHANSPCGGVAVGQMYPNAKIVQICVCDAGKGVARRVIEAGHAFSRHSDAIAWSLQEGTTTRIDRTGPPGGLGLFLLRSFVKLNGGSLRIIANRGFLHEQAGTQTLEALSSEMPGTLFQVKLLVRDDVTYTLSS